MSAERKLINRKRKFSKGQLLRVSDAVYAALNIKRVGHTQRTGRSLDATLRRMLGLPDRNGRPQPLIEGMLETTTGLFILKLGATWGEVEETTYKLAHAVAQKRKMRAISPPVRMREIR